MNENMKLPVPRLQLRWAESNLRTDYQWECHYELVIPLDKVDIRSKVENEDGARVGTFTELVVPMKPPSLRGGSHGLPPCSSSDGSRYYDSPYRDGAHAQWDAKHIGNPPIFVIAPDGMAFSLADELKRREKS